MIEQRYIVLNHNDRIKLLKQLRWIQPKDPLQHRICGEVVWWITGKIAGVEYDAWLGETSGMVYLHMKETKPKEYDFTFDKFVKTVRDGWQEKKVAPAARSLFGEDD